MKKIFVYMFAAVALLSCATGSKNEQTESMSTITLSAIDLAISQLKDENPQVDAQRIEKGVKAVASLWMEEDGTEDDFVLFCNSNFIASEEQRDAAFAAFERNLESMTGHYDAISVDLKFPLHVVGQPESPVDDAFAALDVFAHFSDDMFNSKLAFVLLLNFPPYSLEEKNALGSQWSRKQWAQARLADRFSQRVPAAVAQQVSNALTQAEAYTSEYNIEMSTIVNDEGVQLWPNGVGLISHWGLRDELKSNYADTVNGLEKQRLIYQVMLRIIDQTIPQAAISSTQIRWNPYSNEIRNLNGKKVDNARENDTRYEMLLANFHAQKEMDKYCPTAPTAIARAFNNDMEVSDEDIEKMFIEVILSDKVAKVAQIIESRLGRKLEPFDIWYDGFKARSVISEEELSQKTKALYPNTQAFEAAMPSILQALEFDKEVSEFIPTKVAVDPSRGAGHAWGALSKENKSRLRTRVAQDGFDYKGYNIACHEFGHNVEQILSMYYMDYYSLSAVPSTAFTEALAFIFQKRDLQLLGITNSDPESEALKYLDIFWGCYEIMGVSLVDIYTWRWLYDHPKATAQQLKQAVMDNASMVWNKYYEPVLGEKDCTILGIYSHMINYPLYLPNYPYGHIVESQIESYLTSKPLGKEVQRLYSIGRLTPDMWMREAVGSDVSAQPLLDIVSKAVETVAK